MFDFNIGMALHCQLMFDEKQQSIVGDAHAEIAYSYNILQAEFLQMHSLV